MAPADGSRQIPWWRAAPRWQRFTLVVALVGTLALAAAALHTWARLEGWLTTRVSPEALSARLSPHYRLVTPDGEGPFPTALLFSGCDGVADNMDRWAAALSEVGWASFIVDSHTPRDLDDYEVWRLVCAGQALPGAERAGDVLVAMADAAARPKVDGSRLALIGMSHGGWSIMELMALTTAGRLPFNLTSTPQALGEDPLAGVETLILMYPWCGLANRGRRHGWAHDAPIQFILATEDVIAPAAECEIAANRLTRQGRDVEVLAFDGVTHGFDQVEHGPVSTLEFDQEATDASIAAAIAKLNGTTR